MSAAEGARLRVGIVGAGTIAATHARALREARNARLAGVAGGSRAEAFAREHACERFEDPYAMIRSGAVGAISICTPSGARRDLALAAADAGVHVLVEKPIEVTLERARAMIHACERAGVTLGVVYQSRVKPAPAAVRDALRRGLLGEVVLADVAVKWHRPASYYASGAWRGTRALDGGGVLMNQAIHGVDLLLWLLGDARNLRARAAALRHPLEVEDTLVVQFDLANGGFGTLQATTAAFPGSPQRLELHGTAGAVALVGDRIERWEVAAEPPDEGGGADLGGAASPAVADARWHRLVIEDFAEAVASGRAPLVPGREGARSLAFVLAAYRAAASDAAADPEPLEP